MDTTKVLVLDEDDSLDGYAFLAFRTSLKGHQFVAQLNRCAGLELRRIVVGDDLPADEFSSLGGKELQHTPFYAYYDDFSNLAFLLVDALYYKGYTPEVVSALQGCDKIMIIKGMRAEVRQQEFFDRLTAMPKKVSAEDLLQRENEHDWRELADSVVDVNYFDFSDSLAPRSSQWTVSAPPYPPKLRRIADTISHFFSDFIFLVEQYEDECLQNR